MQRFAKLKVGKDIVWSEKSHYICKADDELSIVSISN